MTKEIAIAGLLAFAGCMALQAPLPACAATGTLGTGTLVPVAPGDRTFFAPAGTLLTKSPAQTAPEPGTGSEPGKAGPAKPDQRSPAGKPSGAPSEPTAK